MHNFKPHPPNLNQQNPRSSNIQLNSISVTHESLSCYLDKRDNAHARKLLGGFIILSEKKKLSIKISF